MSILSSNLKLLREEANYTTEELSRCIGVDESDITAWESGTSIPSAATLMKLCQVLKMPFDDVTERDLVKERAEALKEMKKSQKSNNGNYDWYFGNPKWKAFYISYIIFFFVGVIIAALVILFIYKNVDFNILQSYNPHKTLTYIKIEFVIRETITVLSVFGLGSGIFYLIHFFRSHDFNFKWWYLFWISLLIAVISLVGIVMAIPFLVTSFKKVLKKR